MGETVDRIPVLTRTIIIILLIAHGCAPCEGHEICEYRPSKDGKVANCSFRGLKDVPPNIDNDTVILDLHANKIQSLLNDSFEGLPILKSLNLGTNKINVVEMCSFCSLTNLQYLNMSNNQPNGLKLIRNITYGLQSTNVTKLDLTHMEYEFGLGKMIYKHDLEFANKTFVRELNVSSNMLETIEYGSVNSFPPNLQVLDVSDNRPVFGEYIFEIKGLKNLRILHANKLNNYHALDVFHKRSLDRETFLNALYNMNSSHSSTKNKYCFPLLPPKLEEVYCHNSMIPYDIPRIPVCPDNSLRRIELFHNAISQWFGPLEGFNKLEHIDLSLNFCDNISDYFFSNVTMLKTLRLRANFIGYVVLDRHKLYPEGHPCPWLQPLTNLIVLDLYLNKIRKLPRECLSSQRNLENLILRENSLTDWELRIGHMPNISFIDLSGNSLDRFPEDTMEHLSQVSKYRNVTIDLSGNDIECVCNNIDFLEWFARVSINFINKETYMCRTKLWNTRLNMSNIEEIIEQLKLECTETDYIYLNTVLSVLIGCFSLAVLYGIYRRYRWKLSYMYYTTWGRYTLEEDDKGQYCYDAYIAYSEEENHFAQDELASKLEDTYGLSLYLFDRDCTPGQNIHATIVDNLEKSRKTILLFTGSFVKNKRCLFELQMANEKRISRNAAPDSIYLIQLESVPDKDIPKDVFRLFQSDLYIEYPHDPQGNNIFWERLKNTIKPSVEIV